MGSPLGLMLANAFLDRFLPSTYKFGTVYALTNRCLQICSSWTKSCNELVCLKFGNYFNYLLCYLLLTFILDLHFDTDY